MVSLGINMRPHESVTVKVVAAQGTFFGADPKGPGRDPVRRAEGQVAWAF